MGQHKYLIVIGGATATGKTALAIRLALHFGAEILSADSRQFYREMSIGTAKPNAAELAACPHHFINSLSVHEPYSVGDFEKQALQLLGKLYERQDLAILVGGSGLYLRAVCEGLDDLPEVPDPIKQALSNKLEMEGIAALQAELKAVDPALYDKIDLQNPHRLLRALSVCRASGRPFSSFHSAEKKPRFFTPIYLWLDVERPVLYDRINGRVDEMMQAGLLAEAQQLFPLRHLSALQTVGYQELFDHFEGKTTLTEAVEKIKQNSRNYAKRQVTWFRKDPQWQRFGPEEWEITLYFITNTLNAAD